MSVLTCLDIYFWEICSPLPLNGCGPQKKLPLQTLFFTDYKKSSISRGLRNWPAISNIQVLKKWCHFGKRCEGLLWNEELRAEWHKATSKETKKSVKNEKDEWKSFSIISNNVKTTWEGAQNKKFGLTSSDCLRKWIHIYSLKSITFSQYISL